MTDTAHTTITVDLAILGWGKAGKTLAADLGSKGTRVAVIEQSSMMSGGTCINIGCVPTKALVHQADVARTLRAGAAETGADEAAQFRRGVAARDSLIDRVRAANFSMLDTVEQVMLVQGRARMLAPEGETYRIEVTQGGERLVVEAPTVVINTGAVPVIPGDIAGIDDSIRDGGAAIALDGVAEMATAERGILTSTTIQHIDPLPAQLVIIGGGPIALEFASIFAGFGSKVSILNRSETILGNEDAPVRDAVREVLDGEGVRIIDHAHTHEITGDARNGDLAVRVSVAGTEQSIAADAVLLAVGRAPATVGLGLENAGIALGERGEVRVDEYLRTSAPGVYAVGDVNGGPQQTYVSLDDYRIVRDQLAGTGTRSVKDRVAVPTTIFLTPPLSAVGLTESAAREQGYAIRTATVPVAQVKAMPRPKAMGDTRGLINVVVDADTDLILGARLFHIDSQEVINLVALAMRTGVSASALRDGIWTHPSSTEALNEVLGQLRP
ncbi:MAG: FAD-dependent oxidoreductase [Dermabacter sp.]|nr:FAD-dependent oxidoreductase [Dermabacter sp.]